MDMFGRDSDTTSDGEDDDDINIGAQDVRPAAEAVESPAPPPPAVGRALFARAVSDDDTDTGDALSGGGETKGEDPQPPPPHPPPSSAAQPVKTLPRPAYEGDKNALIKVCVWKGSGDVDEARDLIARGINIDEQDRYRNWTALMHAVTNNRLEMVQELIRAGAALDVQSNGGYTALIHAALNNRLEMVQELIRAGAALDVQDTEGRTALMISVENDRDKDASVAIATLLRKAGARCLRYKRSGVFNSKCKFCRESKKRHS